MKQDGQTMLSVPHGAQSTPRFPRSVGSATTIECGHNVVNIGRIHAGRYVNDPGVMDEGNCVVCHVAARAAPVVDAVLGLRDSVAVHEGELGMSAPAVLGTLSSAEAVYLRFTLIYTEAVEWRPSQARDGFANLPGGYLHPFLQNPWLCN